MKYMNVGFQSVPKHPILLKVKMVALQLRGL